MSARPTVIKLGGMAVDDPARARPLLEAIVALHRKLPGGVVIVHGGGAAVDLHLARLGLVPKRHAGLRITSDEEIDQVVGVLAGVVNTTLVGALDALGGRAIGLVAGDGGSIRARRHDHVDGVDLGRVGVPAPGDPSLLNALRSAGFMPVIAPIGFDASGLTLNINADDAAAALAGTVGADRLLLLTDVPGILNERGDLLERVSTAQAQALIERGVIHGGMIPKVRAACRAAASAGIPTIIASWNEPQRLGDLVGARGPGTTIELAPAQRPTQEHAPA